MHGHCNALLSLVYLGCGENLRRSPLHACCAALGCCKAGERLTRQCACAGACVWTALPSRRPLRHFQLRQGTQTDEYHLRLHIGRPRHSSKRSTLPCQIRAYRSSASRLARAARTGRGYDTFARARTITQVGASAVTHGSVQDAWRGRCSAARRTRARRVTPALPGAARTRGTTHARKRLSRRPSTYLRHLNASALSRGKRLAQAERETTRVNDAAARRRPC